MPDEATLAEMYETHNADVNEDAVYDEMANYFDIYGAQAFGDAERTLEA